MPQDVSDYLKNKSWKPAFSWLDVRPEEHAHAFTVAKATEMDVLSTIKDELQKSIDEGMPFANFQKELTPKLQELGWWGKDAAGNQLGSPRRLKTIYWANTRTARVAGQWAKIQRVKDVFPYLQYRIGHSENHRHQHVAWNMIILPADDPFWDTHFPPNGWGCKCWVKSITRLQAKKIGVSESPKIEYTNFLNKRTFDTWRVPKGIDAGWHTNAGKERLQWIKNHPEKHQLETVYKRKLKEITETAKTETPEIFSTNKNFTTKTIEDFLKSLPDQERVEKLKRFITKNKIQTIIVSEQEMTKNTAEAIKLQKKVKKYISQEIYGKSIMDYYALKDARWTNGFTYMRGSHVVVKNKAAFQGDLWLKNSENLKNAITKAIKTLKTKDKWGGKNQVWSFSEIAEQELSAEISQLTTWLHEVGHQIHAKAGFVAKPRGAKFITEYSRKSPPYEWFSEHFVAWLTNYEEYVKFDKKGAQFFDKLLEDE